MHYCTIFSRLPTSACASRHAPYVSCWMAFRIIAQQFGIEKRISDRPHAMLWLFKTYALSAGMYASQIWFTQFLKHDNGFSSPLQVAHMAFLKRILGIESTSANWCVLWGCAQEHLQFYWFRSAVKFWNRMVNSNSNTLRDVMKADIPLGILVLLIVGLDRWRTPLVICIMHGTVYKRDLLPYYITES